MKTLQYRLGCFVDTCGASSEKELLKEVETFLSKDEHEEYIEAVQYDSYNENLIIGYKDGKNDTLKMFSIRYSINDD